MAEKIDFNRRRLLQVAGLGVAGLAAFPAFPIILKNRPKPAGGSAPSGAFAADLEIDLVAGVGQAPVLPGKPTRVWRYQAKVIKGDSGAVIPLQNTFLGPILKFKTGQRVRINLHNRLPERHITHWHGMHSPFEADGHPSYAIDPGQTYVYEFEVKNHASTNWYHPHTNMVTGAQAYAGLAGLIIVEDDEEQALPLPRGEYDMPLVLQDRTFTRDNQFLYNRHGPIAMLGFLGEKILVNGRPDFTTQVENRAYRFRVLNGSNSRIYKLAWSDGKPITVIGTDGGLLERPVTRPYLMIGPGERYELWKDFSKAKGKEVVLESLEYHGIMPPPYERRFGAGAGMESRGAMAMGGMSGGMGGRGGMGMMGGGMGMMDGEMDMMGGGMGGRGGMGPMAILSRHIPQGSRFTIARFQVSSKAKNNQELPDHLRSLRRYRIDETVNPDQPRPIAIGNKGRQFTLNGEVFEMEGALPVETFPVNTTHLMKIFHAHGSDESQKGDHQGMAMGEREGHGGGLQEGSSKPGGMQGMAGSMGDGGPEMQMAMMMAMVHPIHLHGQYFQIVRRKAPEQGEGMQHGGFGYETVKDGFVDEGWQDTVLALPGEEITLIKPFPDYKGLFLYHCHNLEHEDSEMMRNFKVI